MIGIESGSNAFDGVVKEIEIAGEPLRVHGKVNCRTAREVAVRRAQWRKAGKNLALQRC